MYAYPYVHTTYTRLYIGALCRHMIAYKCDTEYKKHMCVYTNAYRLHILVVKCVHVYRLLRTCDVYNSVAMNV